MDNTREKFRNLVNKKNIICYGAGKKFQYVKSYLDYYGLSISYLIDKNTDKIGDQL